MKSNFDKDLAWYFTNVDYLRELFKNFVAAPVHPKRIIAIHGVGGVGKSSLLRMFRLYCNSENVPVALVSGDYAKSAFDVLIYWEEELKENGVTLSSFSSTLEHWRAIQAKVGEQAKKAHTARQRAEDIADKAASKTGEAVGGALAGAAIGSVIPGIGTVIGATLGSILGGVGVDALVSWLRGFLTRSDIELLLDPTKRLSKDFLDDVEKVAKKQRIVLMIDTFEQMTAFEDWVRDMAQLLPANTLLVLGGRALPNWNREWPSWLMHTQVEELKPMTKDVMRDLVYRYYATMRGGVPDPKQVEAIVDFARGLPMVVASAVRLWVEYGVEDFQTVRSRVVADLVERLMEGVPADLLPAIESAAIVRYFDRPILRSMMEISDVRNVYNELQKFPFMLSRAEGYAMHDSVREIMNENQRVLDSERYYMLHERAAVYFENRLKKSTGEESGRFELENLYHCTCLDEELGLNLFQGKAEELVRYHLTNRLQSLLSDVNTYLLEYEGSRLWREYYNARLAHLTGRVSDAEKVYQMIGENEMAPKKLRAYALCDWGGMLSRYETLSYKGGVKKATQVLLLSGEFVPLDSHLVESLASLAKVARYEGKWDKQRQYLDRLRVFFEKEKDNYGVLQALTDLKEASTLRGDWKGVFITHEHAKTTIENLTKFSAPKGMLLGRWVWVWALAGRYTDCEEQAKQSLAIVRDLRDDYMTMLVLRDLGWALGVQDKFSEAHQCFVESLDIAQRLGNLHIHDQGVCLGFWGLVSSREGDFRRSQSLFKRSSKIILDISNTPTTIILFTLLGIATEIERKPSLAEKYYIRCREWASYGNNYFYSTAITGLIRLKQIQGKYHAIKPLLTEAEQIAVRYEYNDCLASLRLTQGLMSSSININQFDEGLAYFKQAMIYALRYNRYLLDELLNGRPQGTPLTPIIPYLLENGEEGKKTLIKLRNWWETGINDVGTQRLDTIAPLPEGITLLEAESIARERELGDGKPQKRVLEQIDTAL
jgi:hypothetical protein